MNSAELTAFTGRFIPLVANAKEVDIVIAPPFTLLDRLAQQIAGTAIQSAGQNVNPEESGAFTGEIAPGMLADLGCAYAIVGHSERRILYGESDEWVARKAAALLNHRIRPIVCVGETLEQRDAGRAFEVVEAQVRESLARVPSDQAEQIVVAYEPVWAIGTGRTATRRLPLIWTRRPINVSCAAWSMPSNAWPRTSAAMARMVCSNPSTSPVK